MSKKAFFATIWSIISVLGFILYFSMQYQFIGYFLGFHFIKDLLVFSTSIGLFSNRPELMFALLLVLLIFIIVWIISLIKIKKSNMFYWLVLFDNWISLLLYTALALLHLEDFNAWSILIGLIIENVIIAFICLKMKTGSKKRYDTAL